MILGLRVLVLDEVVAGPPTHEVLLETVSHAELPEVNPDADDTSAAMLERVDSFPRNSFVKLTIPRVNQPASFWEPHITEDRKRLIQRLEAYGKGCCHL